MSTITTSTITAARSLAPTFNKQFATTHAPRQVDIQSPKVSVRTFFSMPNLCQIIKALDSRFGRNLGVAIEMPVHGAPEWHGLGRTENFGGQLAIVVPPQSRLTLPMLTGDSEKLQIAGWADAHRIATIDQAIAGLLNRNLDLQHCFILRPEWHNPTPIHAAIGRHITV